MGIKINKSFKPSPTNHNMTTQNKTYGEMTKEELLNVIAEREVFSSAQSNPLSERKPFSFKYLISLNVVLSNNFFMFHLPPS